MAAAVAHTSYCLFSNKDGSVEGRCRSSSDESADARLVWFRDIREVVARARELVRRQDAQIEVWLDGKKLH